MPSQKDYVGIAQLFREYAAPPHPEQDPEQHWLHGYWWAMEVVASYLKENPLFDRGRFLKAAGHPRPGKTKKELAQEAHRGKG